MGQLRRLRPWSTRDGLSDQSIGRDLVRTDRQAVSPRSWSDQATLIPRRLPELLTEVDGHLASCKKDLAELPVRSISDPVGEVWRLLSGFKRDVEDLVAGRPDDGEKGLIQMVRGARQVFRETIFKGAPRFRPWTKPATGAESPTTPQDTANGLEPQVNADDTVVYANEVMDRART
jgi:hypothetical protein